MYTYGAPRAGNHRFAHTYMRAVPDTWHIIHDQVGGGAGHRVMSGKTAACHLPSLLAARFACRRRLPQACSGCDGADSSDPHRSMLYIASEHPASLPSLASAASLALKTHNTPQHSTLQDVVPRGGKFLSLYKRNGQRVIINRTGDLVVRPGPLESSLLQLPMGSNPMHHLLAAYQASLTAIALAQLDSQKQLPGGTEGLLALVQDCPIMVEVRGQGVVRVTRVWGAGREPWKGYLHCMLMNGNRSCFSMHKLHQNTYCTRTSANTLA